MLQVASAAVGYVRAGRFNPFSCRDEDRVKAAAGIPAPVFGEGDGDGLTWKGAGHKHGFTV
jgi:hypothetical protein